MRAKRTRSWVDVYGLDPTLQKKPVVHYHWAVYQEEVLTAHEFWHPEIWTTEKYRLAIDENKGRPQL